VILESKSSPQRRSVVVIGAGQAGLSASYELQQQGIRPLVLEKNRVAYAWDQQRWDSFCLVTPNWQCRLPDFPYKGDQPDGFMGKASIVDYLQRFAQHVNPDLREGVSVTRLTPIVNGYRLDTSEGVIEADHVIVATGGYHIPRRHPFAERLPAAVQQLDARSYQNPEALPDGPVRQWPIGQPDR
jgi:putative flavoprotein involved in K+ transport